MATPQYISGTDGRFKQVALAPNLLLQYPVIGSPTTAAIAGITAWKLNLKLETGRVVDFESSAYSTGGLAPERVQGGILEWSVAVEGIYDRAANPISSTQFFPGQFTVFDLIFSKGATFGYKNCVGEITDFAAGPSIGQTPQTFTATIAGHGLLPTPT